MLEFYRLPFSAILGITLLSALCVTAQAVAAAISFNRRRDSATRWCENFAEALILIQIVLLALLLVQVLDNIKAFRVADADYTTPRYAVFAAIAGLSTGVCILRRRKFPLAAVPASLLTLPIMEGPLGRSLPYAYALILLFWLGRALYIIIRRREEQHIEVSAFTIKEAMDSLHTGLLYCNPHGTVYLVNRRMQKLMVALTGAVQRDGRMFLQALREGATRVKPESFLLDGRMVFRLEDGSVWLFGERELSLSHKRYIQLSATDVTERWRLTRELMRQEEELRQRGEQLAATIENLETICRDEQLLRMRSQVHDHLAQHLAMLMHILQADEEIDSAKLESLSGDMLSFARGEIEREPDAKGIAALCKAYSAIGVTVEIQGDTPAQHEHAAFFFDFVREGAANAVRHGFATAVYVRCENTPRGFVVSITNNGFDPTDNITEGGGIAELRRRLAELGGTLTVEMRPHFALTAHSET